MRRDNGTIIAIGISKSDSSVIGRVVTVKGLGADHKIAVRLAVMAAVGHDAHANKVDIFGRRLDFCLRVLLNVSVTYVN